MHNFFLLCPPPPPETPEGPRARVTATQSDSLVPEDDVVISFASVRRGCSPLEHVQNLESNPTVPSSSAQHQAAHTPPPGIHRLFSTPSSVVSAGLCAPTPDLWARRRWFCAAFPRVHNGFFGPVRGCSRVARRQGARALVVPIGVMNPHWPCAGGTLCGKSR